MQALETKLYKIDKDIKNIKKNTKDMVRSGDPNGYHKVLKEQENPDLDNAGLNQLQKKARPSLQVRTGLIT